MKRKLLIIDDDRLVIKVIRHKFKLEGFEVVSATNGDDGLRIALREHPDVILMDVSVSGLNGDQLLEELRGDTWGAEVPIIFITNSLGLNHFDEPSKYGPQDFLVKSDWKLEDIVDKVCQSL